MGIIQQNSIFGPGSKYFKFYKESMVAVEGANLIAKLDLCNLKIKYDQYYRTRVIIPKSTTNFNLNLSNLTGSNNLIFILAYYKESLPSEKKYLNWTLEGDDKVKNMAEALMLTSTADKPIPQLIISNPDSSNSVTLEIMASTLDYNLTSTPSNISSYDTFLYNISLPGVRTLIFGQSIGFYNDNNSLLLSINLNNINSISINNKIVEIDDISSGLIGIQMDSAVYARQLLSAINWILDDIANRSLPVSLDILSPEITYKPIIVSSVVTPNIYISLDYPLGFVKQDAIDLCINSVIDARDGVMSVNSLIVEMTQLDTVFNIINNIGTYNLKFKAKDLAGNEKISDITITFI
jgi:hypothetical protein